MSYAPQPAHHCPRCDSPAPHLRPSVQSEGEVEVCPDDYHLARTNQNTQPHIDAVLGKRAFLTKRGEK